MKSKFQWVCFAFIYGCAGAALAAEPAGDLIHGQLYPPELLMQHREEIGLSDEQVQQIRGHLEQVGTTAADMHKQVEEATSKLAELLAAGEIDEAAAMKQLDQVLAAEEELKRLHLRVMIRVKNVLTSEQQQVAAKIRPTPGAEDLQKRLRAKILRIQTEIRRRAESGRPPRDAVELMQSFPEHMQAGRHKEAEAVLDRVMKLLGLTKDEKPESNQQGKSDLNTPPAAIAHVPANKALSFEAIQAQVEGLRKQDVAWRKIDWKTCLLDGLKASREQHKPIMLWIFIDRPIDDERC